MFSVEERVAAKEVAAKLAQIASGIDKTNKGIDDANRKLDDLVARTHTMSALPQGSQAQVSLIMQKLEGLSSQIQVRRWFDCGIIIVCKVALTG